ncbi:MAG: hypothetical protein M5U12_25805 [Verrucomicrobia bacterium]|nr:hypothetical protein [Verrucomicrobiota bacterium]
MEIDLYRDDGIPHVITTGASYVDKVMWISSYFGCARYDGRHWRGYFDHDCGLPSNFNNNLKARSGQEAWFCSDKGLGACMDAETCTWVTYIPDGKNRTGHARIMREDKLIEIVDTGYNVPHLFQICVEFDGNDVWAGTSKGVGRGIGTGYYPRLRQPKTSLAQQAPAAPRCIRSNFALRPSPSPCHEPHSRLPSPPLHCPSGAALCHAPPHPVASGCRSGH